MKWASDNVKHITIHSVKSVGWIDLLLQTGLLLDPLADFIAT